jgi:hypothetical protein
MSTYREKGWQRTGKTKKTADWYASYPAEFAFCRTYGHAPKPYTVQGIQGGWDIGTRCGHCGRVVIYPTSRDNRRRIAKPRAYYDPRYLAPKGVRVDKEEMTIIAREGMQWWKETEAEQ